MINPQEILNEYIAGKSISELMEKHKCTFNRIIGAIHRAKKQP